MNANEMTWHPISPACIKEIGGGEESQKGFRFFISPTDIPAAWRTERRGPDKNGAWELVLEFKYLSSKEQTKSVRLSESTKLAVGKHSGRIHRLHVVSSVEAERWPQHARALTELLFSLRHKELREGNIKCIAIILSNDGASLVR